MRTKLKAIGVILTFLFMSLQGCAMNKAFVEKDLQGLSPITVVRHRTPELGNQSLGKVLAGAVLAGGLGAVVATQIGKEEGPVDFGELVVKRFIEQAVKEIPQWPVTTIKERPIDGNYSNQSETLLEFKVTNLIYHSFYGICTETVVKMKKTNGDVVWKKTHQYDSRMFDRKQKLKEYQAQNGKLLREELKFAAEKTVSDFIEDFNGN